MQLEWDLIKNKEFDTKINELTKSAVLSQIIANRGFDTYEKAKLFLNPKSYPISSPDNFLDMAKAVERIKEAIEKEQHIVICGDFDCDGVTSTSVLYKTLLKIGAKVGTYIPSRQNESHGLNSKAIVDMISQKKAKLIITVDNGISNVAEVKLAQGLRTDVIITDHHEPSEILPPAYAILNPKCPDKVSDKLEFGEIENMVNFAGVMVAYKLACKLLEEYNMPEYKTELLPYVMLGTISDVMPLTNENRATVCFGLDAIKNNMPLWMKKIFETAERSTEKIESETIAFLVAPRINAAGRLEDANSALELLVSDDAEKINFCATKLDNFNQTRQQMCETSFNEAVSRIHNEIDLKTTKAIVLADEKWHVGIVGLMASKIVEAYNRPAFIMTIDKEKNQARCSIRGLKGLNIYKVLTQMSEYFEGFGGHELAGGFSVDLNKHSVKEISEKINQIVLQELEGNDLKRKISIDAILEPKDLTVDFVERLSILEPFGEGNPSCLFGMENLILKKIDNMGSSKQHLKMLFETPDKQTFTGIIWNKASHKIELLDTADVTFVPQINEYNGNKSIQLILKNIYIKNREIETKDINFDENAKKQTLLVDHRKTTNFFKMLNSYLAKNKAEVYFESRSDKAELSDYTSIKNLAKNRFDITECDELIFLSTPCSEEDFARMIKKASPQKIHLYNSNDKKTEIKEFITNISGMLKYSANHYDGKIELQRALSFLSVSKETFDACIELLCDVGVIELKERTDEFYEFNFIESKPLNELLRSPKYAELENEIGKLNSFKEDFQTCALEQIKEMIS